MVNAVGELQNASKAFDVGLQLFLQWDAPHVGDGQGNFFGFQRIEQDLIHRVLIKSGTSLIPGICSSFSKPSMRA